MFLKPSALMWQRPYVSSFHSIGSSRLETLSTPLGQRCRVAGGLGWAGLAGLAGLAGWLAGWLADGWLMAGSRWLLAYGW